jgi:hypothetical protein
METYFRELGIAYAEEWKFSSQRKWRFDYAFTLFGPRRLFGVEIEGGSWVQGRHTRGKGFQDDLEKYQEAAVLGWVVLRFSTQDVLNGRAKDVIKRAIRYQLEG